MSTGLFKDVRALNIVPEGYYGVEINVKRFEKFDEGTTSFGDLALDIALVSPDGKELYRKSISKKVKLADQSFLSLAKGLSDALNETIREVTGSIASFIQ